MAIKVKHDGNVTSRIYASAAGGKGKRQSEDAIRLAQLQASAAGRGGGTGGGAHAGATAPTTHAPTSHAQLGSTGSLISPQMSPETRMRLADDELTNKLIEMDNADAYRAAAQERQGDIDMEQIRERARLDAERELTAQGRRERAALVEDVVNSIKAGKFSREELPALMEQFSGAEDMIKMADALREREPTAEEAFRKSTFTDANGVVFGRDGKMLYNPNDTAMRRDEFAAKREDALKARADKYELELRKPVVTYDSDGVKQSTMRTDEEIQQLMQRRFPELYPSAPQTQGAQMPVAEPPPTEDPNDPLAAFKKFRN